MKQRREPRRPPGRPAACFLLASSALFVLQSVLMLYVGVSGAPAAEKTFTISSSTVISEIFKCSHERPIGRYNEYYVACELRVPGQEALDRLEIWNATIDGTALAPSDVTHTELQLRLNTSLTTVHIQNSSLLASAVEIEAHSIAMDAASAINVSARGFKFGPGNYYPLFGVGMGASYGGIGGASLSLMHSSCEGLPPNRNFMNIGDVTAGTSGFRGYGSGGGSDATRGGGRIALTSSVDIHINGSLLSVGANACPDCSDSAGSGGSIILSASGRIFGKPAIKANGGEPAVYDSDNDEGGGGGGGGGRIVFDAAKGEELEPSLVEAFGGGSPVTSKSNGAVIEWCQLGADGTILKLRHDVRDAGTDVGGSGAKDHISEGDTPTVSTLLVKGGRLAHTGPAKRIQMYGCTPIFESTAQGDPFLPDHVANVFITGGAAVCTNSVLLKTNVSSVASSLILDSGSQLNQLERYDEIELSAAKISIQGYIGPSSLKTPSILAVTMDADAGAGFLNALVMVQRLEVTSHGGAVSIDQYSEIKFREKVVAHANSGIQVKGLLVHESGDDPPFLLSTDAIWGDDAQVELRSNLDIELRPQTAQLGAVMLRVTAKGTATIDMPFDTPFVKLRAEGQNVTVINVNSGPVEQCQPVHFHAEETTCEDLSTSRTISSGSDGDDHPYAVSVFASDTARVTNVSAGSVLLCSKNLLQISGSVSSSSRGCASGVGPGASQIVGDASGGAGHGGRGGNVLPGSAGGGKIYDSTSLLEIEAKDKWPVWPGSGAASGDTPNKLTGGNGGGMVYIGTKHLVVDKGGRVEARGGQGSRGGGGGAGGSIMIVATGISGGGVVDASGGEANAAADEVITGVSLLATAEMSANTTESGSSHAVWKPSIIESETEAGQSQFGGGGGGGIIRVAYRDSGGSPCPDCGGEEFAKNGGKVLAAGGKGKSGGEAGGDGVLIASNCFPGHGGALCLPCAAGSHSPERYSKCVPCDPGSFSDQAGCEMCAACPLGHFNPDFGRSACSPCPTGAFAAKTGLKQCQLCAPGSFAGATGSSACAACPIGSISTSSGSTNCTVCGIGETTLVTGATECHACTHKPDHAEFNMRGNCSYACDKGRTGLDCLTPFERFIAPIGGIVGFAALVGGFTILIFSIWACLSRRSAELKSLRYDAYRAQRKRDEQSLMTLTRDLTPRLTDQDLGSHVARLYLDGDNDPRRPWRLYPYYMPSSLRDIVEDGAFAEFAGAINKLLHWNGTNGWEAWGIRLVWCLAPPLGTLLLRRRQLARVERLAKYVDTQGARFFREMNFRVYAAKTKIGFSPDFSLTYVDVLMPTQTESDDVNGLVLVVAGSGSFFRPFHLDSNDVLVRAVPSQLALLQQSFWIEFIADVNALLRVLPQPSSRIRRVAEAVSVTRDILFLVQEFNKQHVEDGFALEFGTFSVARAAGVTGQSAPDSNAKCFECFGAEDEQIEQAYQQYATEAPFKLAFRVVRLSVSSTEAAPPAEHGSTIIASDDNTGGKLGLEDDPRPAAFRLSQIRMQALFATPAAPGRIDDEDDGRRPLLSSHLDHDTEKPSRGFVPQFVKRLMREDSALHRTLLTLWQPLYPLFRLRHLHTPPHTASARPWILPATLVLFVVIDMVVAFGILMEFYCVQVGDPTAEDSGCSRVALWSVIGILPGAILGAPLLGLAFVTRKSVFYGKQFALWNTGSVVNLLVAFVCALAYIAYIHEGVLAVIALGAAVKFAEKQAALRCLSQYAAERPLRGWRGLSTTRDWYDAAYTPLAHHEH